MKKVETFKKRGYSSGSSTKGNLIKNSKINFPYYFFTQRFNILLIEVKIKGIRPKKAFCCYIDSVP